MAVPGQSQSGRNSLVWLPLIAGTLAYVNTLGSGFVWDDTHLIVHNTLVRQPSPFPLLVSDFWQEGERTDFYRPLVSLSYFLEFRLWKLWPAGYHAMNVVYHLAATLAVTWVAHALFAARVAALIAGVAFAIHPIHTESVAFIAGRPDLIACALAAASFALYVRRHAVDGASSLPGVLLFSGAVLAKETALALPATLLAWELTLGRATTASRSRPAATLVRLAPYLAVAAVYLGLRWAILGSPLWRHSDATPLAARVVITVNALGDYLRLLVAPFPAAPDRLPDPTVSGHTLWALVALVTVIGAAAASTRRSPVPVFLLAWFLLTLLPASPLGLGRAPQVAERFLYIPSAAWAWLLGWAGARLWDGTRLRPRVLRVGATVLALAVTTGSIVVVATRNLDWRDGHQLFTRMLESEPRSYLAPLNLGHLHVFGEDPVAAEAHLRRALHLRPNSIPALLAMAVLESRRGHHDLAIRYGERARALGPGDESVHDQLGAIYGIAGRAGEAAGSFREAIRLNPRRLHPRSNLVVALTHAGRPHEAAAALADAERVLAAQSYADPTEVRTLYELRLRLQAMRKPS